MSSSSPVRLFPCIHCWTPAVKCPNYVFLNRSSCVDCQSARREVRGDEMAAAEVHENFVRYLLEMYTENDGITYERVNGHIAKARAVHVDNLLNTALDYIWRNFLGIYDKVCDELEKARDRGPQQWTPVNLSERLERWQKEDQDR
ncbi:hypothetical protein BGZ61DRAFT_585382 [Ilyonectria robusta]|uniref:uncharacterized protein n=1 Tax=Ilyonectria robusta TaxID=1079257 RepID=UPI001E8E497A|nr:uncharacterized protein BGZ61DRAFT_585382 [Ilyonectria robusta]KAH6987628.1 hypothetical protein BKA56DRAFT_728475 [Ilyonectria sp. MPI-CAGE-AT-0026]KAH8733576.1 hypothetical protein BGZ61DRAFT_585382 [Ilyonectria robusta]